MSDSKGGTLALALSSDDATQVDAERVKDLLQKASAASK
jgi:hypothetical protein